MKGIMFTSRGVTEVIDEPMPTCRDDEVLLQTLFSGVSNGTERSFLVGGPYGGSRWPNRIGYLNVSRVIEKGARISRFAPGDVVYTGTFPGHVGFHTAKESDLIVKVPSGLDPAAATMLGIAGVSYFNAARVGVEPEDKVLVTGAGAIGLMAVQAAKSMGARVTLASRTASRREKGIQMGADVAFDPDDDAEALLQDGPYSVLLECAGVRLDSLMAGAKSLLARFTRAALVAGRMHVEYSHLRASVLRVTFTQSTHFDQAALDAVTALAARGAIDLPALVRDIVPIDDAVRVYDTLRDAPMSLGGTVFHWGQASS